MNTFRLEERSKNKNRGYIMSEKKKKAKSRFVEDDPDSLISFSEIITDEERKRAEEAFGGKD